MTLTLGIDTATEDTVVAAVRGDETLHEEVEGPASGRPRHGPALLPMVERAVAAAGGWPEVERIAVGLGPGSFTGLRIGIATAKALGRSAGVEVSGVLTLDVLAAAASARSPVEPVMAAIDARRGQIFAAVYAAPGKGRSQTAGAAADEPFVCELDQLGERLRSSGQAPRMAVGSGALRFRDQFEAAGMEVPGPADPLHSVSGRWIVSVGDSTPRAVEPIYLRAPDAERWLERARTEKDRP